MQQVVLAWRCEVDELYGDSVVLKSESLHTNSRY